MIDFFIFDKFLYVVLAGIFGLMIGSFLNVVIYRKPIMMEHDWRSECQEILGVHSDGIQARYTLSFPRSACPSCGHQIRWYENIPVVSYLFLAGRCSGCNSKIGIRYPLIEILTAGLFAFSVYRHGDGLAGLAWCFFCGLLICLAFIDWDTQLLPDEFNYILLWGGIMASSWGLIEVDLRSSVLGAFFGYLSLWFITKSFYLITKKQGMGNGDFKLYAALGAWFGWQALVPIILLASLVGAIIGVSIKFFKKEGMEVPIPFGPFLVGAGFLLFFLGSDNVVLALNFLLT